MTSYKQGSPKQAGVEGAANEQVLGRAKKIKAANDNAPAKRMVVLAVTTKATITLGEVDVIDRLFQELASLTAANDNTVDA